MRCWRRNPHASHIGLILDSYGGSRTIVADKRSMRANTRHDEWLFTVPKIIVYEPIAWAEIPRVIAKSRWDFERWLDTQPNLTEEHQRAVLLYRLHKLRHPAGSGSGSMHLPDYVET